MPDNKVKPKSQIKDLSSSQKQNANNLEQVLAGKTKKNWSTMVELIESFLIESLSTFDLITDGYLIYKFVQSRHTAWTCVNLLTMIWPFFISQIPFTAFQLEKFKDKFVAISESGEKPSCMRQIIWFLNLTPLLLIYLFILDLFFLGMNALFTPIMLLLTILTCGRCNLNKINACQDKVYQFLFGMQEIDVLGFRRLRTSSQLTFESIPQVMFQTYIFLRLKNDPVERVELDISIEAVTVSLASAVAHTIVELIFIYIEKEACKTTFLHYTIVCFNGRFGWVPFTNHFVSATGAASLESNKHVTEFNYDHISSKLFCLPFDIDFYFTDDTLLGLTKALTNLPMEQDLSKRPKIIIGSSLRNIKFEIFKTFLNVASQRVNLDISAADLAAMDTEGKSIEELMKVNEESMDDSLLFSLVRFNLHQILPLLAKNGVDLTQKCEDKNLFEVAVENNNSQTIATLISLGVPIFTTEIFKERNVPESNRKYNWASKFIRGGNQDILRELILSKDFQLSDLVQDYIYHVWIEAANNKNQDKVNIVYNYLYGPSMPEVVIDRQPLDDKIRI